MPSRNPGLPERSAKGSEEREGRHVIWLAQGPVVGGEGPGQGDLAQRQHEVGQPEEHKGVEDLQAQQCAVVAGFTAVEGKLASGVRARVRFSGIEEGLREGHRDASRQDLCIPDGMYGIIIRDQGIKQRSWGLEESQEIN